MRRILVALTLILIGHFDASGQPLQVDPARDIALTTTVRAFLDGTLTSEQLETELRTYARAFEQKPYAVHALPFDWENLPRDRVFAFLGVTMRIAGPAQAAFIKREVTAAQAAVQIAPFALMWLGYGVDHSRDDPQDAARFDELLTEIHKYSASTLFGHVAEGYTSPDHFQGVNVAPRMFSAPDNVCETADRPAALAALQDRLVLRVGQPFALSDLVIVARDAAGAVLQRVPIAIEVESVEPPLLDHLSNAVPENHLHPLRSGTFRIRARTLCAPQVHVFIDTVIK